MTKWDVARQTNLNSTNFSLATFLLSILVAIINQEQS